ncbi:hypothetical protein NT01EI_1303 [Edwardsiella ictaluri 93-146]|uniref:Uncharacterized protein n=1 Tax=Edwardsiella ictaluri (strain 93-146) TaxID=634503 RepID=C5BCP5_EDWI9|nr:hypothetical protein NT01EI_1303 [Edwardsiella ictaluri 93-146]
MLFVDDKAEVYILFNLIRKLLCKIIKILVLRISFDGWKHC